MLSAAKQLLDEILRDAQDVEEAEETSDEKLRMKNTVGSQGSPTAENAEIFRRFSSRKPAVSAEVKCYPFENFAEDFRRIRTTHHYNY